MPKKVANKTLPAFDPFPLSRAGRSEKFVYLKDFRLDPNYSSSKLIDNTENYSCRFNEVDKNGSFIGMIALEVNLFQNNAINTPPIPKNVVKSSHEILADS